MRSYVLIRQIDRNIYVEQVLGVTSPHCLYTDQPRPYAQARIIHQIRLALCPRPYGKLGTQEISSYHCMPKFVNSLIPVFGPIGFRIHSAATKVLIRACLYFDVCRKYHFFHSEDRTSWSMIMITAEPAVITIILPLTTDATGSEKILLEKHTQILVVIKIFIHG